MKVRAITLLNISVACLWAGALAFNVARAVPVQAAASGPPLPSAAAPPVPVAPALTPERQAQPKSRLRR